MAPHNIEPSGEANKASAELLNSTQTARSFSASQCLKWHGFLMFFANEENQPEGKQGSTMDTEKKPASILQQSPSFT